MEDKYALKLVGAGGEVRGEGGSFVYWKLRDLRRVVPLPAEPAEPPAKQARMEARAEPTAEAQDQASAPEPIDTRLRGRVKWFSKEKGFGKITPNVPSGQPPAEEIFVHRSQMDGGQEGLHAQAIREGVSVSYEVTTHVDGKPCACSVQVEGVARRLRRADSKDQQDLVRRLLLNGLQVGSFQEKGQGKATMEDRMIVRTGISVDSLGASCRKSVCALYGVFDGHSGASCSDFVATNLDRSLFDCLRHQNRKEMSSEMSIRSALLGGFRMTEHNYFQYLNKLEGGAAHAWATAGTTACSVVLFGPDEDGRLRLATANAGDSRAA